MRSETIPAYDNKLILRIYYSKSIAYELPHGNYTVSEISVCATELSGGSTKIEHDYISLEIKTYFNRRHSCLIGPLRFDELYFFKTLLDFIPYWAYEPNIEYIDKKVKLIRIDKIQSEADCLEGSVVNGFQEPIVFSFVFEKFPASNAWCESETIKYSTMNKTGFNTNKSGFKMSHRNLQ